MSSRNLILIKQKIHTLCRKLTNRDPKDQEMKDILEIIHGLDDHQFNHLKIYLECFFEDLKSIKYLQKLKRDKSHALLNKFDFDHSLDDITTGEDAIDYLSYQTFLWMHEDFFGEARDGANNQN